MSRGRLLVEGPDDKHVMWSLLAAHDVEQTFVVEDLGGVDRVIENLRVRLHARADERLGVIVDADEKVENRWHALHDSVERIAPGVLPASPDPRGTVVALPGGRRLGIWLMPDNRLPGILEDFVALLVPAGDPCWAAARTFVDGLEGEALRFSEPRRPKARLHAWLAVQAQPGRPIGQAITAKCLEATSDAARPLIAWIERVFGD
ncbi:MAG: DUF3226 domain-containing protein [Myxococcota bacterium]